MHMSVPQSHSSAMDGECVALLPRVCELLAASGSSLPDDTSLEKLLDWFTQLYKDGTLLQQAFPCLLDFISTVVHNTASDPAVLSFTIKLTGLIAANEEGFKILQERCSLDQVFTIKHWQEAGVWEDPTVKSGWIQGIKNMMQHPRALRFFVQAELIEHLLQLQTDPSLFVASAASQLLAHILLFYQPESLIENCQDNTCTNGTQNSIEPPTSPSTEYKAVVLTICEYLKQSLLHKEHRDLHHNARVLKLVAQILAQAGSSFRRRMFEEVQGSLEVLVTAGYSQLTLPLMEVILAAHSVSCGETSDLLSAMLDVCQSTELIRAAATVLQKGLHDPVYTPKAVRILLRPLHIVTAESEQGLESSDENWCQIQEQLSSKSSCTSMICTCLTNLPQVLCMPSDFQPISQSQIVTTIVSLLHISIGDFSYSSSTGSTEIIRNIVGNSKVQKCALDALTALNNCSDMKNKLDEVFKILLMYLKNPDSEPTVLQKCYQALVKWTGVCTNMHSISDQLRQDLLHVVQKRVCDVRWEVRDSTVEFLGQQTVLSDSIEPAHSLIEERSTIPLLREALQDQESYVRASAVSALAQTLKKSWRQGATVSSEQSEIVTILLSILTDDTEGFSRRAVLQYFIIMFSSSSSSSSSSSPSSSLLMKTIPSVLSRGSSDLDWEVKIHTLELAEMLTNKTLAGHTQPSHPYAVVSHPTYNSGTSFEEEFKKLVEFGVISALLSGLFDCDRPVALKACQLLIKMKETVGTSMLEVKLELPFWGWGREIRALMGNLTDKVDCSCELVNVCEILRCLGLEEKIEVLSQSSDHVQNSPLSLLQDILTARDMHSHSDTAEGQEVIVDCY